MDKARRRRGEEEAGLGEKEVYPVN